MFSENETYVVESNETSVLQRKLALDSVRGQSYGEMEVGNFKVFNAIEENALVQHWMPRTDSIQLSLHSILGIDKEILISCKQVHTEFAVTRFQVWQGILQHRPQIRVNLCGFIVFVYKKDAEFEVMDSWSVIAFQYCYRHLCLPKIYI